MDPAKFKAESCYQPKSVPSEYIEHVGTVLAKTHLRWIQLKAKETWWAEYGFVANQCTASLMPGGIVSVINLPDRQWNALAAEQLARGEQPGMRMPLPDVVHVGNANGEMLEVQL